MIKNRKTNKTKSKKNTWFAPVRGSYLPNSGAGWLSYIPYISYMMLSVIVAIQETTTYGIAILFIVPNLVAATAVMTFIASKKS